jgi:DNA-binding MarR family transcriptional regulator
MNLISDDVPTGAHAGGREDGPGLRMVHMLRAITVELELIGGEFATRNGLHPTDLRALIALLDAARAGTVATPGWLAGQLGLNSASATALVDRLERLGHVRRIRDTADRRRVRLEVTPAAAALGWSFFGPLIDQLMAAMDDFEPAELATITRFLTQAAAVVSTRPHPSAGRVDHEVDRAKPRRS